MKTTIHFKQTIQSYLVQRAMDDTLFAVSFRKPDKNIADCITYILNTVQESGCNGFADDEIFSMAVHYYDEDGIDTGKPVDCNVVVNHTVKLSAEEKSQARKEAIQRVQDECYYKMKQPLSKPKTKQAAGINQLRLF
ncbi:hypothetical protein AGMMS50239_37980 [Bacteroidia bacterium]|nr:hypothetical protein AGMMS50239_37980 [Bacteroidia bacterium]